MFADDIEVRRPDGSRVKLASLWAQKTVVLAFLRHFG